MPEVADRQPPIEGSTTNRPLLTTTARTPQSRPSGTYSGSSPKPAKSCGGTVNSGPLPKSAAWTPPAMLVATTSGTNARVENSNSSSSMASTTAASGEPNVAAMPAAAPHARRILRSFGDTCDELAEQRAQRAAGDDDGALGAERAAGADGDRGGQRLGDGGSGRDAALLREHRFHRLGDAVTLDHRGPLASSDTISAPLTATITSRAEGSRLRGTGGERPARPEPNSARLVSSVIRWTRT